MKMRCRKARKQVSLALDERLAPSAQEGLQRHLSACPGCRQWRQDQDWLREAVRVPGDMGPEAGFHSRLMARLSASSNRPRLFAFPAAGLRPAWIRAAAFLAFIFSALFGFFLGNRLERATPGADSAAFSQALNLDAFADQPLDSFGSVYERLLQGEIQ